MGFLCSDVMEEYKKEMKALCVRIMWLMLASLGITKKDFDWAGPNGDLDGSWTTLQLNWYPTLPGPQQGHWLGGPQRLPHPHRPLSK
ncbi:hypothetical protein MRB53_006428 [Persea americana]|uniref:Uncharacterized protein n=1 Tax=Persea americana TaxID=3435 RepID=A0ACC2MG64_PERAE|nr:hypothetical protein MRB53_006428 [Persea americana]